MLTSNASSAHRTQLDDLRAYLQGDQELLRHRGFRFAIFSGYNMVFRCDTDIFCLSIAMLWFDFLTTIDMEYHRIWERKFTGATLVYVGIRYAAVISRIFLVLELFLWNISDKVKLSHTCAW